MKIVVLVLVVVVGFALAQMGNVGKDTSPRVLVLAPTYEINMFRVPQPKTRQRKPIPEGETFFPTMNERPKPIDKNVPTWRHDDYGNVPNTNQRQIPFNGNAPTHKFDDYMNVPNTNQRSIPFNRNVPTTSYHDDQKME